MFDFNVFLTHDDLYNTNAGVGITLWLDGRNFADDRPNLDERVIQRMVDTTQRK
ncbi:hypothetical protein OAF24_01835 [bacterium]|nr:hypothetical protein [bacterium]